MTRDIDCYGWKWCSDAIRWPWQTVDVKNIMLISRYYKRSGQKTNNSFKDLAANLPHEKEKFPMGKTASHRTCGLCKWLHWPAGPGSEKPSSFCSQWLSLPWAAVAQDTQRQELWRGTGPPQGASKHLWAKSCGFSSILHPMLGTEEIHRLHLIVK